jgi:hypothetical protein
MIERYCMGYGCTVDVYGDTFCPSCAAKLQAEIERLRAVLFGFTDWATSNMPSGCSCHDAYLSRNRIDPQCEWCNGDWILGSNLIKDANDLLKGNE